MAQTIAELEAKLTLTTDQFRAELREDLDGPAIQRRRYLEFGGWLSE